MHIEPQSTVNSRNRELLHTPGPWTYGVRKDGSIWLSLGDPKVPGTEHHQGDLAGTEADARPIVTAPLLLAAAEAHAAWAWAEEGHGSNSTYNERMELCNYAEFLTNTALAAARGEPLPDEYTGVPHIVVRFPFAYIDRAEADQAQAIVERLLAEYRAALKIATPEHHA